MASKKLNLKKNPPRDSRRQTSSRIEAFKIHEARYFIERPLGNKIDEKTDDEITNEDDNNAEKEKLSKLLITGSLTNEEVELRFNSFDQPHRMILVEIFYQQNLLASVPNTESEKASELKKIVFSLRFLDRHVFYPKVLIIYKYSINDDVYSVRVEIEVSLTKHGIRFHHNA